MPTFTLSGTALLEYEFTMTVGSRRSMLPAASAAATRSPLPLGPASYCPISDLHGVARRGGATRYPAPWSRRRRR
jgi:hypothetical protein